MQISLQSKNAALTALRSAFEQAVQTKASKLDENLIAAANHAGGSAQAKAGLAEDLFSVHHMDAAQMKVRLFERLGEKFGLNQDDFETQAEYARAIGSVVKDLAEEDGGLAALAKIEKELGLDDLGVSIDNVIKAMIDPASNETKKLHEALNEKIGKLDAASDKDSSVKLDEDGLYSR